MTATGNSCFCLADFYKSSSLKPLGQMNQNLVGSIYERFSIKIAHFVPIRSQTWPSQSILVSPTRNKNCLWQPCLLTDRDEISNLYREPSMDTSYQVSVQLAKQGRRILEIDL
jgi:hypothetical protein